MIRPDPVATPVATLIATPSVRFVGRSGSGKTTLVSALIKLFSSAGRRVGAVKHASKSFQMDHEGKDTYRFRASGAASIAVASPAEFAVISQTVAPATSSDLIAHMPTDLDLILIEGFKGDDGLAIEVHRGPRPPLATERLLPGLVAIVTDRTEPSSIDVPHLDISNVEQIAEFIEGIVGLARPRVDPANGRGAGASRAP